MEDPLRMSLFRLAGHLSKSVTELECLPYTELLEWVAFFRIEAEESGSSSFGRNSQRSG